MENIKIDGYGTKSFEDYYLLGIREINPVWNNTGDMNVLKAQAIAARTYAVKRTNNGDNSICTTTACQVFSTTFLGGAWATAVAETKGMILVNSDGTPQPPSMPLYTVDGQIT
jgi:SpoIID/LytB domain protein